MNSAHPIAKLSSHLIGFLGAILVVAGIDAFVRPAPYSARHQLVSDSRTRTPSTLREPTVTERPVPASSGPVQENAHPPRLSRVERLALMREVFAQEAVDYRWSPIVEARLKDVFAARVHGHTAVLQLACRTTLCMVVTETSLKTRRAAASSSSRPLSPNLVVNVKMGGLSIHETPLGPDGGPTPGVQRRHYFFIRPDHDNTTHPLRTL